MDIKPFSQPIPDFWASLEFHSFAFMGITALCLVGIIVTIFFKKIRVMIAPLTLLAFLFGLSTVALGYTDMQNKHLENYNDAISELEDSLSNDGFQIVSGSPSLRPNAQSSLLLSYEGKNFDCTMFSPKDVITNIVFSCGEAKLSLEEIKKPDSK